MAKRRIQNTVAESVLTLPAFGLLALCLWRPWTLWHGADWPSTLMASVPLVAMALSAYVLLEWGARWQVIRIRTRLVTALFMLGLGVGAPLIATAGAGLVTLTAVCVLFCLACCYERQTPVIPVFHIALCLSLASMWCSPLLWLWPVAMFCLVAFMRAFSLRVLSASVIGLLTPWFFASCWKLWSVGVEEAMRPWVEAAVEGRIGEALVLRFGLYGLPHIQMGWVATGGAMAYCWLAVTVMGLVAMLHFFVTRYDDKIRTRMLFYTVQVLWLSVQALMACHPWLCPTLLPALWLFTCPLASHHLALSSARLTTVWLLLVAQAFVAGTVFIHNLLPL